ncbi:MAG: DUF2157 domain-containing protein [Rhodospirillaceae bacterium]|nr:DUF2157 domain-containing protein [Rhodospirillaceae bacterium]MDE0001057.1 DUF2157 domain-containing protein [Rhodospirillaceae bacterium]MDE0360792.1 DUF2157 domain-containing protein [Rhodospirillaceae bacterium]
MAIDRIAVDRRLVEELHAQGYLSAHGREAALEWLNLPTQWEFWIARSLLVLGSALLVSGVLYFAAYNWNPVAPALKFAVVQVGLVVAVVAAIRDGLTSPRGQVLIVFASVLVGVFLAVFGQVFQTGADAYRLFAVWSALILGFSVMSNFAPQWTLWLAVTNTAAVLWWWQALQPSVEIRYLIFGYLALLNGTALGLREWAALRGQHWIGARWTRWLLVLGTLGVLLNPALRMIMETDDVPASLLLTGIFGLLGHVALFTVYRHALRDTGVVAATILSGCLILEAAMYRAVVEVFGDFGAAARLSLGVATVVIFSAAMVYLRSVIEHERLPRA